MNSEAYNKYERAKKKVEGIKSFHNHLKIFVLVSILILVVRFYVLPKLGIVSDDEGFINWLNWNTFIFPGIWLLVLLIHALTVYGYSSRILKKWEERKIREFIENDEQRERRYQ